MKCERQPDRAGVLLGDVGLVVAPATFERVDHLFLFSMSDLTIVRCGPTLSGATARHPIQERDLSIERATSEELEFGTSPDTAKLIQRCRGRSESEIREKCCCLTGVAAALDISH
jgi:hypothetical protein